MHVSSASAMPTTSTDKAPNNLINSDFQMFLKMMTTQMQNQDPLDPTDPADFAMQLATFSGVEQQAKTNTLLESMQSLFAMQGMSQMANWVGREALSTGAIHIGSDPVTLAPKPEAGTTRAVLNVYDATGALVAREDIPVSSQQISWVPEDSAGNPLASGQYSFKLESYKGDELLKKTSVEAYGKVVEVRAATGGAVLVLEGGSEVPASAVTALR